MKNKILFLTLVISIHMFSLKGQDVEKSEKWTVAFGYSPLCDFDLSAQLPSEDESFYWSAGSVRLAYKLSQRLSISAGVGARSNKLYLRYDYFPDAYVTRDFVEFPIQLNYSFKRSSKTFKPYIKTALINSFLNSEMHDGPLPYKESDYNILADFGIGTKLGLINKFSAVFEISVGYFLKYQDHNRGYIDSFLGLQYEF